MKISQLIENWEPGDWPFLKDILLALAGDKDVPPEQIEKGEG